MNKVFVLTLIATMTTLIHAQFDTSMFPKPKKGYEKKEIHLKPQKDELAHKVELIVGKTVMVDTCNRHFVGARVTKHNLNGWGYDYYTVEANFDSIGSTLMGCKDNRLEPKFVGHYSSTDNSFLRYNSRMPIVVYLPKGATLKYRVWSAGHSNNVP